MYKEIKVSVEKDFLDNLKNKLNIDNNTELLKLAFTFLNWKIDEEQKGRVIFSSDTNGYNLLKLN